MRLYFIRHGQSTNNALWDDTSSYTGRNDDPELTDAGKQQAKLVAAFLAREQTTFGVTHIYASLMVRAVETALAIGEALRLPVAAWEDMHETGGIFLENESGERIGQPGKGRAHFESAYPTLALPDTLNAHGWWSRPHEEREASTARAERFVRELQLRHGNTRDRVVVVSHGNFYRYTMATILGMADADGYFFALNNAALSRIDFPEAEGEVTYVAYLNRSDYLPAELLT